MSEMSQERRNIDASKNRPKAVKKLSGTDFGWFVGSGFNIQISQLDGTLLCPEFTVNGEDMASIAPHIVKSLREALKLTKQLVLNDLAEIEEAIAIGESNG